MVQKAQLSQGHIDIINKLQDDVRKLYSLYRSQYTPGQSLQAVGFGSGGGSGRDPGGAVSEGDFLPLSGGTMTGAIAFHPKLVSLTSSKRIDISKTGDTHSTRIILSNPSGFDLEAIDGATHAGQLLILQGVATESTNVINSADNIETLDGTTFVLQDDDNLIFIFDSTDNKWQQLTIGKQFGAVAGGANTSLSNLVATAINQDLDPDADGTRDIGSGTFHWDDVFARAYRLKGDKNPVTNTDNFGANATEMWWNVDSGKSFVWSIFGTDKLVMTGSVMQWQNGILALQMIGAHTWSVTIGSGSKTEYRSGSGGHEFLNGEVIATQGLECNGVLDMDANDVDDVGNIIPFSTGTDNLGEITHRFGTAFITTLSLGSGGGTLIQDASSSMFFTIPNGDAYNFFITGFGTPFQINKDNITALANLRIFGGHYVDISTMSSPGAPSASTGRMFFDLSGGKVRFRIAWPGGAITTIATEP